MIDLIVAEPNPLLRCGIRTVLEAQGNFADIAICAEVSDADKLRLAFLELQHNVVLIGLGLLMQIGVAALRDWRSERPHSRLLVHSYEIDAGFAVEASRFGVVGYLSNDCSASDLRDAIVAVAAGQPYITRSLGAVVAAHACFQASNRAHSVLSTREAKIFQMLSIGLDVKSIARQLDQKVDAIQAAKWRIMSKMTLPDISELVRWAIVQTCQGRYRDPDEIWLAHA